MGFEFQVNRLPPGYLGRSATNQQVHDFGDLMQLEFRADDGGFFTPDDPMTFCLLCAVSGKDTDGAEHHITIQRIAEDEDPSEDNGIHFCFDDQINGAYNCVQKFYLTRLCIDVQLLRPIDWQEKIHRVLIDVSNLADEAFDSIRRGLPRIFRGTDGILDIALLNS